MKRIALIATCILLVLIPSISFAYSNNCSCCEYSNGGVYCTNIKFVNGSNYVIDDETYHLYYEFSEPYCRVCGDYVGTGGDIYFEEYEKHTFRNNTCTKCGYSRGTGNAEQEKDIPSGNELQAQAYQMGDKLIGAMAKCVYGGNIRQEPSEYAYRVGKIQADDTYKILDYEVTSSYPTSVWLKIDYGYTYAWVSASLMQITGANGYGGYASGGMTGQIVRIHVSSGRARTNPGSNYPIIEYVGRGEEYTVLDSEYINGNLWYKIKKDQHYCWISSGITK